MYFFSIRSMCIFFVLLKLIIINFVDDLNKKVKNKLNYILLSASKK